jgi:hypothetical protein
MAYNFSPKIVTDGLVLYLDAANTKSYVSGSTTWNDISRGGNNGTLTNGPTFNTLNGGSIVFDTLNSVTTNYTSTLTDFTVCVWFKPTDSTNIAAARILDKNYISGFWVGKNTSGVVNSWGGGVRESAPPYGRYITLLDTQWNFIVSTRSGTTHTIYGNGITNTSSGTVSSTALDATTLTIAAGATQTFKGNIANVSIYNRALSASEVLQNYNATRGRFGL